MQLKEIQNKGTFIDRFDAVSIIVFEVFQFDKNVAKTAGRIAMLAFRGMRWTKDFSEKKILAEIRECEARCRT